MDRTRQAAVLLNLVEEATGNRPPQFAEATELREGLGLDSVDLIALVMQVENHFDIAIESKDMPGLKTVGDVIDLLERKLPGLDRAAA